MKIVYGKLGRMQQKECLAWAVVRPLRCRNHATLNDGMSCQAAVHMGSVLLAKPSCAVVITKTLNA